jgi:hypothetical protein
MAGVVLRRAANNGETTGYELLKMASECAGKFTG